MINIRELIVNQGLAKAILGAGGGSGGSGGSGGGSLPAGVYWKPLMIMKPNYYCQKWVEFNGILYAFTNNTIGNGTMGSVYKYVNGTWESVVLSLNTAWSNASILDYVEHNGKLHIIGGSKHYIFNGSNLIASTALPANTSNPCTFIQNNQLKVFCSGDQTVYVWNETSSTWSAEATLSLSYTASVAAQTSEGVIVSGSWLSSYYIYDGQGFSEFANVGTFQNFSFSDGRTLYQVKGQQTTLGIPQSLYKFDMQTKTWKLWCATPGYNTMQTSPTMIGGKLHLMAGDDSNTSQIGAFELVEIEAIE